MIDGVSYHANGCKCLAFPQMVDGVSYHGDGCECWACLSDMVVDVLLPWSDISAMWAFLTGSDISVEEDEDLHGG